MPSLPTSSLPDVNVWLALVYALHPHHKAAVLWFNGIDGTSVLFFCRVTQMSLLRLLTQRQAVGSFCLTQADAWKAFDRFLLDPRVGFWDEPLAFEITFRKASSRDQATPKLWTDDYLVAFAEAAHLTLITLDKALASRAPHALLLNRQW